jgi:hypothetical protein
VSGRFSPIDWLTGIIIRSNPDDLSEIPKVEKQNPDRTGTVTIKLDGTKYRLTIERCETVVRGHPRPED